MLRHLNLLDMIVFFKCLEHGREVQALEAADFYNVVFKAPLVGFKGKCAVNILEQARDCVGGRAHGVRNGPEYADGGEVVSLNGKTQPHTG